MRFIHIADVHLGKIIDEGTKWSDSASKSLFDSFVALVDAIDIESPDFLFITGDLFDHVPTADELSKVDMQLSRLDKTNIIYVTGEKDYLKKGARIWKYKFMSRLYLLNGEEFNNNVPPEQRPVRNPYADGIADSIYFPEHNLDIYGICQYNDYNGRNDLDYVYAHDLSRVNILLAHGGSREVSPFTAEDVKTKKFDYIGMGHFHECRMQKELNLYYPGSLEAIECDSTGEHGYIKGFCDKTLLSCKFVASAARKYKTIYVEADETLTNTRLVEYIEKICNKESGCIYTIDIKRSSNCYTDFDLSKVMNKYRIVRVNGDKANQVDFERLEKINSDNIFGASIKRLRNLKSSHRNAALTAYAYTMSKILWGSDNIDVLERVANKDAVNLADKAVKDKFRRDIDIYKRQMRTLMEERERVQENLAQYPDTTGELNTIRALIKDKEFVIDQIRFSDAQVDKIYNRKRLGFILLIDVPFALLVVYLSSIGVINAFVGMNWDNWLTSFGIGVGALFATTIFGVFIYNNTKKLRKRLFGSKIPYEEHTKNKLMMAQLEDELAEYFSKEAEYDANRVKHFNLIKRQKTIMDKMEEVELDYKRTSLIIDEYMN